MSTDQHEHLVIVFGLWLGISHIYTFSFFHFCGPAARSERAQFHNVCVCCARTCAQECEHILSNSLKMFDNNQTNYFFILRQNTQVIKVTA